MRKALICGAVVSLALGASVSPARAQKGMGDATGVARASVRPEVVSLSGKVLRVETGPCEKTTGRADVGSHFILQTPPGQKLNVHLGPAAAVGFVTSQLSVGKEVKVEAL